MKVAIPSMGKELSNQADERFGRAAYYIIYDVATKSFESVDNTAKDEVSGAGGSAVRLLDKEGVKVVLVPEVGPKALAAFKAFEMKAFTYEKGTSVADVIRQYQENALKEVEQESHGGYHGLRRA